MPFGIIESAAVIAAATGTYQLAKRRKQRARRRNFFKEQRESGLDGLSAANMVAINPLASAVVVADAMSVQEVAPDVTPAHTDELERIWGIGPIYVERLNDAGVYTFADLASQTPDQLRAIVSPSETAPSPNVEAWIDQAAELSKK